MHVAHALDIDAPPALVWAVTTDIDRWPEWTPTVTAARRGEAGPLAHGATARLKQPAQAEATWTVTEFVDGVRFTWTSRRPGLVIAGSHEVRPRAGGGATSVLGVGARGVVAVLLAPLLRCLFAHAIARENAGLRRHCEALAAASAA